MPRPVSMRVSYRNDIAYFLRLGGSVMKDKRMPEDWNLEVRRHLGRLTELFAAAEKKLLEAEELQHGDRRGKRRGEAVQAV